MIDCKITENYLKERARMCESIDCKDCVLYGYGCDSPQTAEDIQRCINAIQAWSDAHKTYLSDFLEKYPDASLCEKGSPRICLSSLGYAQESECPTTNGAADCIKCWNRPLEPQP